MRKGTGMGTRLAVLNESGTEDSEGSDRKENEERATDASHGPGWREEQAIGVPTGAGDRA